MTGYRPWGRPSVPTLATAIRQGRDHAYPRGQAIPAAIRKRLAPFSRTVLQKVRYSTEWQDATAESALYSLLWAPAAEAVTLGDVIIFRDAQRAADPLLWAHELTHVEQYERLRRRNISQAVLATRLGAGARSHSKRRQDSTAARPSRCVGRGVRGGNLQVVCVRRAQTTGGGPSAVEKRSALVFNGNTVCQSFLCFGCRTLLNGRPQRRQQARRTYYCGLSQTYDTISDDKKWHD